MLGYTCSFLFLAMFRYIVFQFCFTFHFLFDDIMISLHCCRLLGVWNVVLLLVRLFHTVDRLSISHLNSPYHIILCREKIYCITFYRVIRHTTVAFLYITTDNMISRFGILCYKMFPYSVFEFSLHCFASSLYCSVSC